MATAIEALFKYSYEYDGKTISFLKGEKFSLIKKVNGDWWQAKRKHDDGRFESIYVPANYMREVEDHSSESHTYQNMADLQAEYAKQKERLKREQRHPNDLNKGNNPPVVRVSPKLSRTKSSDSTLEEKKTNGNIPVAPHVINPSQSITEPEYAVPQSPISKKRGSAPEDELKPIVREWQQGYSLPQHVKIRSATFNDTEVSSLDSGSRNSSAITTNNGSKPERHNLKQLLNSQLGGGGRGTEISQPKSAPAPKTKPKTNSLQRPKSYCVVDDVPTQPSTFMSSAGNRLITPTLFEERKSFKKASTGNTDHKQYPSPISIPIAPSPIVASPTPVAPPSSPSLPEGWSEHKTIEGKVYYYNCISKESKWTRPVGSPVNPIPPPPPPEERISPVHQSMGMFSGGVSSSPQHGPIKDSPLERVAPRGWTKEINSLTQTPVFTNSRTSEKWAVASDEKGFFYYLISNPSLVLQDLPPVMDDTSESLYDHLTTNSVTKNSSNDRARISSDHEYAEPEPVKQHAKLQSTNSVPPGLNSSQQLDIWSSCMTTTFLRKHGYLQRKKIVDANNKKLRNEKWSRLFVSLQANQLLFYNDHRTKDLPGAKPLHSFNLLHSSVGSANYKDKKKNIMQLSSSMGEQFYLEAESQSVLNDWYSTLQTAIDQTNEDFKKNPDKYSSILMSNNQSDTSPPTQSKFSHKKNSTTLPRDFDDLEEIEQLSGAEKTVRIKGRLRNLIARRPQVETLKKTGIMQEPTFGCSIEALAARTHRSVPLFLENLITHIEKKGLDVIGLYRLSGNASQVQKLRYLLEDDPHIDLSTSEWADVNVVTGCLKLYFRELPDPLLPFRFYKTLINTTSLPPEKRPQAIANEINKLPDPNYRTLKSLIKHLTKVVEHSHINKMLANNLGIVFGPTLMRSEVDSLEIASLMPLQNNIVETIIREEALIFKK